MASSWRRGVSILCVLELALAGFATFDATAEAAAVSGNCADVTSWAVTVNTTYYFVKSGGGWISSYGENGSGQFGTVSLSVSQTSFHAVNPYTIDKGYIATFSGNVGPGCLVTGTWTAVPGAGAHGVFTAKPLAGVSPPQCVPHLTGTLRYETGETIIDYTATGISSACGRVGVVLDGKVKLLPSDPSTQSGSFVLPARQCGTFRLVLAIGHRRRVSPGTEVLLGNAGPAWGKILYSSGDVTGPDGETLHTGDELCASEYGTPQPANVDESEPENTVKVKVGSTGALWLTLGIFAESLGHFQLTAGEIDVPAAHIHVVGQIASRRLVLGLGNGKTVTLTPPETAPSDLYPPGHIPFYNRPGLLTIRAAPTGDRPFILAGYIGIIPEQFTVIRLTVLKDSNGFPSYLGVSGTIDFKGGITGSGAVVARGDITESGKLELGNAPENLAFASLGTISLLGTN